MIIWQPDRHRYMLQVHPDERAANIQARVRADLLHSDRVLHGRIRDRGKGPAGMGVGYRVDDLIPPLLRDSPLHDQRPV